MISEKFEGCDLCRNYVIYGNLHNYIAVRLADSGFPWKGRVEIFVAGEWGTICDDHFSDREARVSIRFGCNGFSQSPDDLKQCIIASIIYWPCRNNDHIQGHLRTNASISI